MMNSILTLLAVSHLVLAHGEDKPGPHGGFIQMPGSFHTELVPLSNTQLKIYLLDMAWKNPTTHNSEITLKSNSQKSKDVKCSKKADHFLCELSQGNEITKKGSLELTAKRQGVPGNTIIYQTPLKHAAPHH